MVNLVLGDYVCELLRFLLGNDGPPMTSLFVPQKSQNISPFVVHGTHKLYKEGISKGYRVCEEK